MMKKFLLATVLLVGESLHAALVQTAPHLMTFDKTLSTTQHGSTAFYLGASPRVRGIGLSEEELAYKLSALRANDYIAAQEAPNILQPLAPSSVTLDGTDGSVHPLATPKNIVGQMGLFYGQWPMFSVTTYESTITTTAQPTHGGLFMLAELEQGKKLKTLQGLNDTSGNPISAPIAALAGGNNFVFAAVADQGSSFDDANSVRRGVVILQEQMMANTTTTSWSSIASARSSIDSLRFVQVNPEDGTQANPHAFLVSLQSNQLESIAMANPDDTKPVRLVVGPKASLCWDEPLQRLYIGFTDVRRADSSQAGGAFGLFMAYPDFGSVGLPLDPTLSGTTLAKFAGSALVETPSRDYFYQTLQDWEADNALSDTYGYSLSLTSQPPTLGINKAVALLQQMQKVVGDGTGTANDMIATLAAVGLVGSVVPEGGNNVEILSQHAIDLTITPAGAGSASKLLEAVRARVVGIIQAAKKEYKDLIEPAEGASNNYTNSPDFIIGFYADGSAQPGKTNPGTPRLSANGIVQARENGDAEMSVSIPHIAMLHTSTGKPYLVVNSVIASAPSVSGSVMHSTVENWIYALPLIPDDVEGAPYFKGSLAAVDQKGIPILADDGAYSPVSEAAEMPQKSMPALRIGGGNPLSGSWVEDLWVQGDTVYAALGGYSPDKQGLVKSSAIFNAQGLIVGWTPAELVLSGARVFGGVVDTAVGSSFTLTSTVGAGAGSSAPSTGQVSRWGRSDELLHGGAEYRLDTVFEELFPADQGGVLGLMSAGAGTAALPEGTSLLVALGADHLAVVQTAQDGVTTQSFALQANASKGKVKNVWQFSGNVLAGIAPLTCASVGLIQQGGENRVCIFVGGARGLARLVLDPNNLADDLATESFAQVMVGTQPFKKVVAVGQVALDKAGGENLFHIVTSDGIYQTNGAGLAVAGPSITTLAYATDAVATVAGSFVATSQGVSFVPVAGAGATSFVLPQGAQALQLSLVADRVKATTLPTLPATVYVLAVGPTMPDDVLPEKPPQKEGAGAEGNVLQSPAKLGRATAQIWRLAVAQNRGSVSASIIDVYKNLPAFKGSPKPFLQFTQLRSGMLVDGATIFDVMPRDASNSDFLNVTPLMQPFNQLQSFIDASSALTELLEIDQAASFNVGRPIRDAGSGTLYVPGDWGIRVHE